MTQTVEVKVRFTDWKNPEANNETFDFPGYWANLRTELAKIPKEVLPKGVTDPLEVPDVRKRLTRHDPLLFAVLYMPHLIQQDGDFSFADLHLALCRYAMTWKDPVTEPRSSRDAFIAPRDCGKSTWLFTILPIWALAHAHIDFIAAFSSAGPQATRHLSAIKNEFDNNAVLRTDYPDLCDAAKRPGGQSVADTQKLFYSKSRQTIAAAGLDEEILGLTDPMKRRPQLLILDDIEPGEENYSLHQAEKRRISVRDTILPMNERAHVCLVGTVTMLGSLVHQLVQTITEMMAPEPWIEEERFRVHYFDPIPDGVRSIWKEKWTLAYLHSIQHMRSFKKNFLNQPIPEGSAYWQEDSFTYGTFPCVRYLLQIDPATTRTATSDYYGLAVIGFAPEKRDPHTNQVLEPPRCLVLYARAYKISPAELRRRIVALVQAYDRVGRVRIETNQGGDTWKEILKDLPVPLLVHTESVKKEVRAADLLAWYERGQVVHERRLPEAEMQMMAFPNVVHDDLIDAIGAGVRFFLEGKRRKAGIRRSSYI
jgi:predicted phage terminase large subunit-like protein